MTITVKSAQGSLISNASVKVSGAGITAKTQKTGAHGTTVFKLHPTKAGQDHRHGDEVRALRRRRTTITVS